MKAVADRLEGLKLLTTKVPGKGGYNVDQGEEIKNAASEITIR